ncbi:MAG TPA: DUF2520 domain-containing protein [Pyrinomonadaceae bacterium]|jgi:predicted short-subunit dehydrogenase-like oxidoreductase (DUF2520 family)
MPTERRNKAKAKQALKRAYSRERKPTITIIGAGRLGTALALALEARGYSVEALIARRLAHARRAAARLSTGARALAISALDALPASDLLFITTPDDQLESVAASLAALPRQKEDKARPPTALHCSGALSSEVLSALRASGFRIGSMHPLVSVSGPIEGAERLGGAFYCVEGDAGAVRLARRIVRDLAGESFSVGRRDKALYHAAAVTASGHLVALFDLARSLLMRCGLTERKAGAVLMPLVESTVANLAVREPARALTGTFARADPATMRRHLEALRRLDGRDALAVYKLLGRRSLTLAEQAGADREALKEMARALEEDEES